MSAARTKKCEHVVMYVARSFGRMQHWKFRADVVPVCDDLGIEPMTRAMQNLRNAHMIERCGPPGEGWHRITAFGRIELDSARCRAMEPLT